MKVGLWNLMLPLGAASLLCACATTVEIQDVKITELATLDSDYRFVPGKSSFEYEGEFEGQALSNVSRVKNKSFLALSFTSPDDLKHMASELRGSGLRYWIAPCDKNAKPKESRYGDGVMVPSQDTSEIKRYFVFIPKSFREAMHAQSSGSVVAYRDYMKDAISNDVAKDLCLDIGAIQYYSLKKFNGRVGSLRELGIKLD